MKCPECGREFFEFGDGVTVKGATHYLTVVDIKEIATLLDLMHKRIKHENTE